MPFLQQFDGAQKLGLEYLVVLHRIFCGLRKLGPAFIPHRIALHSKVCSKVASYKTQIFKAQLSRAFTSHGIAARMREYFDLAYFRFHISQLIARFPRLPLRSKPLESS
jgi:hypothetical protein